MRSRLRPTRLGSRPAGNYLRRSRRRARRPPRRPLLADDPTGDARRPFSRRNLPSPKTGADD
eukprot:30890-Pelagococcus_subviridis.AAC.2